eukprot:3514941-Prymnesium_polylepis.2
MARTMVCMDRAHSVRPVEFGLRIGKTSSAHAVAAATGAAAARPISWISEFLAFMLKDSSLVCAPPMAARPPRIKARFTARLVLPLTRSEGTLKRSDWQCPGLSAAGGFCAGAT